MKVNITSSLIKQKNIILISTRKRPHLGSRHKNQAGKVLRVMFNAFTTKFEVTDFIKTSKKLRSNVVDIQAKDIFQYNFIGICIAQKKDPYLLNSSFLIRNTFDQIPYELHANLFSPLIDSITIHHSIKKLAYIKRNKYFYLRYKPAPNSTIFFDYVVDMFAHDTTELPSTNQELNL